LALGWVLLAITAKALAASSFGDFSLIEEEMDMAPNSFDDQYKGCSQEMEAELHELNRTEFKSSVYAKEWRVAAAEWQERWGHVTRQQLLSREQATAMLAYSMEGDLYHQFNAATRAGGSSRQHYLHSFPFKTLHFLLSQALRTLRESQPRQCHSVRRGINSVRVTAQKGQSVRFGHFIFFIWSEVAESSIRDTNFVVETCYGVPIQDFTMVTRTDKVLIPPFETFKVIDITKRKGRTFIHLRSQASCSTYNCAFLKGCPGRSARSLPWPLTAHLRPPGRSSPRQPPHLWGLLLAAAALAAVGQP
ncbi:NARE ribosyltransferase, partial [Penelope pileata]|nr:NARE ribosyltransferase [Penelope pileata]